MVLQWNPEQTAVLKLFRRMLRRADSPRRIRVEGPAASGKSALLQVHSTRCCGRSGAGVADGRLLVQEMESLSLARWPNGVMVLAPTNTAADAVGGRTLHRALGIPNTAPYAPLDQAALSELGLGAVRVVLLDNYHQVNPHVLYTADRRFRQAAGSDGEPFGGRIVVVFSDDRSIPPYRNPALDNGLDYVLDTFSSPVLTLSTTYFADPTFGAAVGRLRAGAVSAADRQMYDTRKLEVLEPEDQPAFLEGAKVCYNKDDCAHFNHVYRRVHTRLTWT
ncbi:uncharacterized protein LOC113218087 isoform X1 [Frankliniella occidentalis]|uniref:Uncharacterized protein LOC113218087 isoform X1 n=1 Tax=Frankliniella occidentalis TaxID=133901 RepID=A0A9C6X8G0_FRAOC|nr:uncharacterized protein LOC113218087 isoform X1 [Frankliniella occidentalis]